MNLLHTSIITSLSLLLKLFAQAHVLLIFLAEFGVELCQFSVPDLVEAFELAGQVCLAGAVGH